MEPFDTHTGVAAPLDIANCDTDQIIPARFLRKSIDDPDYPRFLLHDLRFDADGNETDCVLNRPAFRDASIIVADRNWGCGSSRENAVTALMKNGVRVVIAPSFGDIHYNNCIKRGVVPVRLSTEQCAGLRAALHAEPGVRITVELENNIVRGPGNWSARFEIDDFDKLRLLKGLSDIALTLEHADDIDAYERSRATKLAWAEPSG